MQRKFKKRLPTAWGYVSKLFLLPLSVRALSLVPRTTLTRNRLRPLWCLWRPLILPSIHLCPSKTLLSSWSSVVICALIARGKLKPELEFQAGTSCSYHALYKHENIGYAEAPDDHMYNTQNSERSDEVSPYLMVACVQVPVSKFPERSPTVRLYFIKRFFLPLCVLVCWCVGVFICALTFVPRTPRKHHRFRPRGHLWRPLIFISIHLCSRQKPF